MATNSSGHPDEVVQPESEVPSDLVAEAQLRHQVAETDLATPQEKKQAAVEQAHALSTRPDGSYAQLHETEEPTLAVADEKRVSDLREQHDEAAKALRGSEPSNSAAGVRREQASADARQAEQDRASQQDSGARRGSGGKDSK
jgi:hypothetical protein